MEAGEISARKPHSRVRSQSNSPIAQGEHRRRAGARRQAERTGFFKFPQRQHHRGSEAERAGMVRRDGDDLHAELFERRQQLHDFARLAALR